MKKTAKVPQLSEETRKLTLKVFQQAYESHQRRLKESSPVTAKKMKYRVILVTTLETNSLALIQADIDDMGFDENVKVKAILDKDALVVEETNERNRQARTTLKIESVA